MTAEVVQIVLISSQGLLSFTEGIGLSVLLRLRPRRHGNRFTIQRTDSSYLLLVNQVIVAEVVFSFKACKGDHPLHQLLVLSEELDSIFDQSCHTVSEDVDKLQGARSLLLLRRKLTIHFCPGDVEHVYTSHHNLPHHKLLEAWLREVNKVVK